MEHRAWTVIFHCLRSLTWTLAGWRPAARCPDSSSMSASVKRGIWLFMGNSSQSYGASSAIWGHSVSPATQHIWARPTRQAGRLRDSPTPERRRTVPTPRHEGQTEQLTLVLVIYSVPEWFICLQKVTNPSINDLTATRLVIEPTIVDSKSIILPLCHRSTSVPHDHHSLH